LTIINQVKIGEISGSFFGADPSSDQRKKNTGRPKNTKNTGHPTFLLSSKKFLEFNVM